MKKENLYSFFYLSKRINKTGVKGREAIINLLSVLGIGFGVVALIVILSVMNGFQSGYIKTIMEVSSGHIRLTGKYEDLKLVEKKHNQKSFFVFTESQALIQGNYTRQAGTLIRAVDIKSFFKDTGLIDQLNFVEGFLNLEENGSIVLGYELARSLSINVGDDVFLPLIAGSSDVNVFSDNSKLRVTGIFKTGFLGVDSSYSFVSLETGNTIFGETKNVNAFVKLQNENSDYNYIAEVTKTTPNIKAESWRTYNHAFFGALRVEKNVMMLLVVLIFIVVSVNIYNGMRRTIYERKEDIAILSSLGMKKQSLRLLFFINGFKIGLIGSVAGLIIGLFTSNNINEIFAAAENAINLINSIFLRIIHSKEDLLYINEFSIFSSQVFYIEKVPAEISFFECCYISLFGLIASSVASLIATRKILKLKPQEILRYE